MAKRKVSVEDLVQAIDAVIKDHHESLIHEDWVSRKKPGDHYSFATCYPAAEALWRLSKEFKAQNPDIPDLKVCKAEIGADNHYWCQDKKNNKRYDPTAAQFQTAKEKNLLKKLYEQGKGKGICNTSNRAKFIVEQVKLQLS